MRLAIVLSVLILSSLPDRTNAQMPAPNAFEAALDRGKTFYRSEQYQAAEEAFREVIRQYPHLPRAHHWLGLALSLQGRDQEAVEQLVQAEQAYTYYISQLDTTEQRLFEDLTCVIPVDKTQQGQQKRRTMQTAYRETFWASRDPDPLTLVNERLLEHYRRIIYAREHFSHNQSPWDTRGDIYIRYGEPDDRQRLVLERIVETAGGKLFLILEEDFSPTEDARIDEIRDTYRGRYKPPALTDKGYFESWVYARHKHDFYFLASSSSSPFEFPPEFEAGTTWEYHPWKLADELIARMPEDYPYDYGGEPLDTVFDLVSFKFNGMKDRAHTYVLYNVPLHQLGTPMDSLGMETWISVRSPYRIVCFRPGTNFLPILRPRVPPCITRRSAVVCWLYIVYGICR